MKNEAVANPTVFHSREEGNYMQGRTFLPPIVADAVHIDSVKLSHSYRASELPSPTDLVKMGFDLTFKTRGNNEITTARPKQALSTSSGPYITVIRSSNNYAYSGIAVEVSLMKLGTYSGLGVQSNEDIEWGLDAIGDVVRDKLNVSFDARTAKVSRFDVNADFNVGEQRIKLYIDSLSRPYSRLTPSTFDDSTVYYYNGSRTFAVYGKRKEMEKQFKKGKVMKQDVDAAEGLLRVEMRLKTPHAVKQYAKKIPVKALAKDLFTEAIASKLMSETINQLDLDKAKISMDARAELLIKEFGFDAPEKLGILRYKELFGEDFWIKLGWSKSTYYRKRKELENVNLWSVSPDEALPALVIP